MAKTGQEPLGKGLESIEDLISDAKSSYLANKNDFNKLNRKRKDKKVNDPISRRPTPEEFKLPSQIQRTGEKPKTMYASEGQGQISASPLTSTYQADV